MEILKFSAATTTKHYYFQFLLVWWGNIFVVQLLMIFSNHYVHLSKWNASLYLAYQFYASIDQFLDLFSFELQVPDGF